MAKKVTIYKRSYRNGDVCYGGIYHTDGTSSGIVTRPDGSTYYCRWDKNGKAIK